MVDSNYWGPGLWIALHSISFDYPHEPTEEDKHNYQKFFHALKYVIPCPVCRNHYSQSIEGKMAIEPYLKNRDTLSRWLVDFHNAVNERLGKPVVTYDSVREKYESMRGKCQIYETDGAQHRRKTNFLLYLMILLLFAIILIVICYIPRLKKDSS
jgi:hypothetical protein